MDSEPTPQHAAVVVPPPPRRRAAVATRKILPPRAASAPPSGALTSLPAWAAPQTQSSFAQPEPQVAVSRDTMEEEEAAAAAEAPAEAGASKSRMARAGEAEEPPQLHHNFAAPRHGRVCLQAVAAVATAAVAARVGSSWYTYV